MGVTNRREQFPGDPNRGDILDMPPTRCEALLQTRAYPRGAASARGAVASRRSVRDASRSPRDGGTSGRRNKSGIASSLGQNFLAKDEWSPLQALRPEATRPTVLELGPREPAYGSDLVRKPPPPPAPVTGPKAGIAGVKEQSFTELSRMRRDAQQVATSRRTVDGHAEAAISVMREFFQTRPMSTLLEVFRNNDDDMSGDIDLEEFKQGLRKLNLDLSDRDMVAVFRAVDADNSGEVDLDEFFNCFRTDSFPRDTFFWSKTRPRGLLGRKERVQLAQHLGGSGWHREYSAEDVLNVVQRKVRQFNAKNVFNSLDENRSGRVSVREFVSALREMEIHISDTKAEEIIADINSRVGDTRRSHLFYRSFCNAFAAGTHEGTTGSDEGVLPVPKAQLWRSDTPANANQGQQVPPTGASRMPAARSGFDEADELDSIQRFVGSQPKKETLRNLSTSRGKMYEAEIEAQQAGMQRHDMLSGWRDGTTRVEKDSVGPTALGRSIDWFDFRQQREHRLLGRNKGEAASGILPGAMPTSDARAAVLKAVASERARAALAATALAADEPTVAATVAGCMIPLAGSPGYLDEIARLTPRPAMWTSPESAEAAQRKAARQTAARTRQSERDARLEATQAAEVSRSERLESARYEAHRAFSTRTEDWQQVIESRVAESGRRTVHLEPASSTDPSWSFAPPHRTSHWDTIAGHNLDPPSRVHVKQIISYRRAFPEVENRPPTPRRPVWGGG